MFGLHILKEEDKYTFYGINWDAAVFPRPCPNVKKKNDGKNVTRARAHTQKYRQS